MRLAYLLSQYPTVTQHFCCAKSGRCEIPVWTSRSFPSEEVIAPIVNSPLRNERSATNRDRVESAEECARLLASIPIGVLVIDRRDSVVRQAHFDVVEDMLRVQGDAWGLMEEFSSPAGSPHAIALYIHEGPIEPVRNLPAWLAAPSVDSEAGDNAHGTNCERRNSSF